MAKVWITGSLIDLSIGGSDRSLTMIPLIGLIDTGASSLCMDRRVAKRLDLSAVDRKPMQMADGSEVQSTSYLARLIIPELGFEDWVKIYAVEMDMPSNRVLLGRSFLKRYHLTYEGPTERFHFYEALGVPVPNYLEDHDG